MNELEALNLAIEREKEAHLRYSEAAERATDGKGKQMFSWLASEEMGHMRILEKERAAVEKSGKWLAEEAWASSGDLSQPIERAEFPSLSEVKGELKTDAPELEILKAAIEAEREAASFYAELAQNISDPNGKAMLNKLSAIETGHLNLLEEEYEWLRRSREFFTVHRFTLPSSA
jgi:rubrerythrin